MCSVASRANNNLKICRPILCLLSLSVAIIIANRVDSLVALVSRGLVTAKPPTSPKHHYKCIKSLSPLALSSSPFNHTLLAFFLIVSLRCKDEDVKKKKKEKEKFPDSDSEQTFERRNDRKNVVSQTRIPFSSSSKKSTIIKHRWKRSLHFS